MRDFKHVAQAFFVAFACLWSETLMAQEQRQATGPARDSFPPDRMAAPLTSIVALPANPQQFDRQHVAILGFVELQFEGQAVYLHREDAEQGLTQNGLWLSFAPSYRRGTPDCDGHYSYVKGVFRADQHGHMRGWTGALTDVTLCVPRS